MKQYLTCAAMVLAVTVTNAAWSDTASTEQITPGTYSLTADGTWDCKDAGGTYLGAIVIAQLSYAFIDPEGTVGTYGTLNLDDWMDSPAFFILNGALKEQFSAVGMSLRGPVENPEDLSNWDQVQLKVVVSPEVVFRCDRRRGPAT